MNIDKLKRSLERSENFLDIVRKIENRACTKEDFEYLQSIAGTLQKEMMRRGHGKVIYKRAFGLGIFQNYQIILNFPVLLATNGLEDEAFDLIPTVKQVLLAYIQEVKDLIENPEALKNLQLK